MKKTSLIKVSIGLLLVVIALIFLLIPIIKDINFGLDLKGGFEILYKIDGINDNKVTTDMVNNTYKVLTRRIDSLGVSEPEITIEKNNKIRIKLAGVNDQSSARDMLGRVANLTFRNTNDELLMTSDVLASGASKLSTDKTGYPAVSLQVKDNDTFYKVTSALSKTSDQTMVIWLDFIEGENSYEMEKTSCGSMGTSKCISSATVKQAFSGDVIIQGNFNTEEAKSLVDLINSGSLPTKLTEISSKTVGAAFGEDTLKNTLLAGVIGIILIMLVLIILYRVLGVISSITIIIYSFLTLSIFWLIGGVLTLPGIAAIVIGIGMAVDSNVISFERIKDELYKGKSLNDAYLLGNKRSFTTILDANITTLIVAVILFVFGESSVKGFATLLIISIIVTLFVMVFMLRFILNKVVRTKVFDKRLTMFIGAKDKYLESAKKKNYYVPFKKLDFVGLRKIFYTMSIFIIIIGALFITTKGLNLGVDYKGGTDISITTNEKLSKNNILNDIRFLNYKVDKIILTDNNKAVDIILKDVFNKDDIKVTSSYFEAKYENSKTEISVVSNIVKKELTINAIYAIIFSFIGIIIYLAIRYRLSYAISCVIACIHDVFIIFAIFAIFHFEVSSLFIAAILAVIGYSINDTIVTFDRIRENLDKVNNKVDNDSDLINIVNTSLKETLLRSIYTVFTTLIPVVCLIFLGAKDIFNFNIALFIGLIAGVYSSLFIACQLWYQIEKKNIGKKITNRRDWSLDEVTEKKIKGINA